MHPESRISFDSMIVALSDIQRRNLLIALLDKNPQDDSPTVTFEDGSDSEVMEHLIRMHHLHLPMLENYGFIEWDRQKGEVTKGPTFDEIRPLLELLIEHEDELPAGWL
jgi:hypothetical protein